jgi:hypothetical protein
MLHQPNLYVLKVPFADKNISKIIWYYVFFSFSKVCSETKLNKNAV